MTRRRSPTAVLSRTGGEQLPDVELPDCVVWKWPATGTEADGPTIIRHCGPDSDGDGYDDSIDCAPNDPGINPCAVDVPNDGIDQNCDGSDLVVGEGTIQVTLIWDNDNDMDLHVIEPNGSRIWYASPGPSATGGRLNRDDNVGVCGRDLEPGGVENTFWPDDATPATGTYTVEVIEYASCGEAANWTLEVRADGDLVLRETGSVEASFTFTH
jgi:hypothetical protein